MHRAGSKIRDGSSSRGVSVWNRVSGGRRSGSARLDRHPNSKPLKNPPSTQNPRRTGEETAQAGENPCLQQFVLLWDGKECSESRSGNDCRNPIVRIESERKV